jgi:hypothetical protein
MKHLKMLGLAGVMAVAFTAMLGSSTSSATELTSPKGTTYKGELRLSAEGSLLLKAGFANITCTESTVAGTPTNFGGPTSTVSGPISTLTFTNCGSSTVTVLKKGSLEVHVIGSGPNGSVTSTGSEVTVAQSGVSCTYATNSTSIGTLTSSPDALSKATMHISAELTKSAGGFLCASPARWEGGYWVTAPVPLFVS